jgi:flagellar biosynthetic protein FliQ
MTEAFVVSLGRDALLTVLRITGPMLGAGLIVGLFISILQATTQIQEQTLSFVPKILAILGTLLVLGPWMLRTMVDFVERLYGSINMVIR